MAFSLISLAVVGANYPNPGKMPDRRFEIALCAPGDKVRLVREPTNKHDPRAVQVQSQRGVILGYLTAERCGFIGRQMQRGQVDAIFQKATTSGCIIRVAFDGAIPLLPIEHPELVDEDREFYPDPVYDDV